MGQIVILLGAPGAGKSTLVNRLIQGQHWPGIELSLLPEFLFMNGRPLTYAEDEENAIAALVALARVYVQAGYARFVISDIREEKFDYLTKLLRADEFVIVKLLLADETVRRRVTARTAGFQDVEQALSFNARLRARRYPNEIALQIDDLTEEAVMESVMQAVMRTGADGG